MGTIWIGTSGFQYPEWKGKFYPRDLAAAKMLPFYAGEFSTTEINYSFFRIPSEKTVRHWFAATPANFCFSLKAPRQITHRQKLVGSEKILEQFWRAARLLGKKLGAVLFQLPPYLKKDLPRLEDFLAALPREMKPAFEFRHASWFDDAVFSALQSRRAALCIADSEKLSTPPVMTGRFGYFRLRDHYSKTELTKWAGIICGRAENAGEIFVYFKHEETGRGPQFARQLRALLPKESEAATPLLCSPGAPDPMSPL